MMPEKINGWETREGQMKPNRFHNEVVRSSTNIDFFLVVSENTHCDTKLILRIIRLTMVGRVLRKMKLNSRKNYSTPFEKQHNTTPS